ncbi:MAG TPA: imelysin family protein [Cytophagaceae bacterium]|jgi:hypothetical protein
MANKIYIVFLIFCLCCKPSSNDEPKPGPPSTNGSTYDRGPILQHIADEIIIPSYQGFEVKLDELKAAGDLFANSPTRAALLNLRDAWSSAYIEWQKVELFNFGPAETYTLRSFFNIYPANVVGIENNVSSGSQNLETTISYPQQGFPALDYLINGLGQSDDEILAKFITDPSATNRLNYLKTLLVQMQSKFTPVLSAWKTNYRQTFVTNTSTESNAPFTLVTSAYIENYERYIRTGKFGIPSGIFSSGTIRPELVEAYYKKDLSLQLAQAAHQASVDFFNGKSIKTGKEGPSLKTALSAVDAKALNSGRSLGDDINSQFAVVKGKLDILYPNFYQEVNNNNQKMVDVVNEMQRAVLLLKGDMPPALSITINYVDTDGD